MIIAGTSVLVGCNPKSPPEPELKISWSSLEDLSKAMVDKQMTPGLSLSVMGKGKLLFSKGFGVLDTQSQIPVTSKSRFRIASVSKQFTAAAILRLVQQNALSLEDPLAKFFPDFPKANEVSLRSMLQHISGMGDHINGQKAKQLIAAQTHDYDDQALYEIIKGINPIYPYPLGVRWAYSNASYALLGMIISQVSKASFSDFCKTEFYLPLGLSHTSIDSVFGHGPDHAKGYRPSRRSPNGFGHVYPSSPSFLGGAGALSSTTEDLVNWHHHLFKGDVLAPSHLSDMLTPAVLKDGTLADQKRGPRPLGYGLGLGIGTYIGQRYVMHNGLVNGFSAHLSTLPDTGLTLALLMNCDGIGYDGFEKAASELKDEARRLGFMAMGLGDIGPIITAQNVTKPS
jgi:D-alanyl-D-alanine carboxypeptidase